MKLFYIICLWANVKSSFAMLIVSVYFHAWNFERNSGWWKPYASMLKLISGLTAAKLKSCVSSAKQTLKWNGEKNDPSS